METVKTKIIIHNGSKEREWVYGYIPNVGDEIITSISSFKVLRKAYEPDINTLHIYLKTIEIKQREAPKSTSFEEQCAELINQIKPYLDEFGKDMCNEFYEYWIEQIAKGRLKGQCRYVEERTWSIYKRLNTWSNNNFSKKK
jgi:hypothetical protein